MKSTPKIRENVNASFNMKAHIEMLKIGRVRKTSSHVTNERIMMRAHRKKRTSHTKIFVV